MIENRQAWLDALFEAEGGWSNHPDDPGRETMMGVTLATLRDWRGEDVTADELRNITKEECADIALSKYWNAVRGDQLPSGLDLYCADFAFGSGPGRAIKELQQLVGTKVDTFVGEKTISAVRAKKPLTLLLDYHAARMEFLMSLKTWDTFGRGWTSRCNKMLAVARTKAESRPMLAEAAGSRTVQAATLGTAASGVALWPWLQGNLSDLLTAAQHYAQGLPQQLQSADDLYRGGDLQGHIAVAVQVATLLFVAWRRIRDWRKGVR